MHGRAWLGREGCGNVRPVSNRITMEIQIAALCDAAADFNGKLCLLGTFDTILAQQMPAVHPQCSIALRVVFSRIEEGKHKVRMEFVNDDGQPVMQAIDIQVEIVLPSDATFLARNFVVNIQQMRFERPGNYAINVAIDGRQEASMPLQVKLLTPPTEDAEQGG